MPAEQPPPPPPPPPAATTATAATARERLLTLRDAVKRVIDYRTFYLRYCPHARPAAGHRLQTLCPIPAHAHSGKGHPSLSVDLARGLFHCFSRDEGGDAIRFYELMHGVKFARAVGELARDLGLAGRRRSGGGGGGRSLAQRAAPDEVGAGFGQQEEGEEAEPEPLGAERLSVVCEALLAACRAEDQREGLGYLARRGIDAGTAARAGVVYFPRRAYRRVMRKMQEAFPLDELRRGGLFNARAHLTFYRHRLLFPFRVGGRAIYLQARTTAAGVEPRWHNMRGGVPSLYNIDCLNELASGAVVYLVEGFTDTLTLSAHGFAAVGLVGAGGLKEEWLAPLGRFRVVAVLDPDAAGRRAAERYAELFASRGLALARVALPADVNDFFRHRRGGAAALEFALLTEAAMDEGGDETKV